MARADLRRQVDALTRPQRREMLRLARVNGGDLTSLSRLFEDKLLRKRLLRLQVTRELRRLRLARRCGQPVVSTTVTVLILDAELRYIPNTPPSLH